jgi:ATP-dependent Clp protease ATP-binding subunit ClpC
VAKKRGTLSTKIPSQELARALNKAASLMRAARKEVLTPEMLLQAFVETPDTEAHRLLRYFSQQKGFGWEAFADDVSRAASARSAPDVNFDFVATNQQRVPLSDELLTVLDEGLTLAESRREQQCGSAHALAVMTHIKVGTHWLLNRRNISQQDILQGLGSGPVQSAKGAVDYVALTRQAQLPPVFPRTRLLENLMNLLSMSRERHVILIGPSGVGKHSLVLALAQRVAEGKGPANLRSVIQLSEHALVDDDFAALESGLKAAQGGALFIPDIARLFNGSQLAFNELQKALLSEQVAVIATATDEQYQKLIKHNIIADHTKPFRVPPATVEETVEILKTLKAGFEADYKLAITDESLAETARLAQRYYAVEPMPGAAVHLLHRACAMLKIEREARPGAPVEKDTRLDPDNVMEAVSMLTGIPIAEMGADERERYLNMADYLHQNIIGQHEAVEALSRAVKIARVGLKEAGRPIGSFMFMGPTGVGKSELAKVLAQFLFGKVGGSLITLDMSEYMEQSSVNRLIGSPPGYVGHEAGGQLTESVKKQPYSVILFDEVEKAHQKVFDVLLQVLDEGRLTSGKGETVSFSECVILMTSNIGGEHLADPRLTEGADTSSRAEPAYLPEKMEQLLIEAFDAKELMILAEQFPDALEETEGETEEEAEENVLAEQLVAYVERFHQQETLLELVKSLKPAEYKKHEPYYNWAMACERARVQLRKHFRPEFLNRLDDIIFFHPLSRENLLQILGLQLRKEEELMARQKLDLEVTKKAKSWLLDQNDHPEWGARPLRRLIQKHIREPMADYLLRENPPPGTVVKVDERGGKLKFAQGKPNS